jgi:hypothetical protein
LATSVPRRAVHLGVVDHDVNLATDLAGQRLHRAAVGEIQRHQRHRRQRGDRVEPAAVLLPRLGVANPDQLNAGVGEFAHQGLADRGHAVGDKHFAQLGVADHLAQHGIVGHVVGFLLGQCDQDGLSGTVEPGGNAHARGGATCQRRRGAGQVNHQRGTRVKLHQPQPPRQPLAKKQVVAVVQGRAGEQRAVAALFAPTQAHAGTAHASLARRVQHRRAVLALLKFKAPHRGRGREAQRDAAARRRRQVDLPRAQDRVLAPGPDQRWAHREAPRITAPVHRQRS